MPNYTIEFNQNSVMNALQQDQGFERYWIYFKGRTPKDQVANMIQNFSMVSNAIPLKFYNTDETQSVLAVMRPDQAHIAQQQPNVDKLVKINIQLLTCPNPYVPYGGSCPTDRVLEQESKIISIQNEQCPVDVQSGQNSIGIIWDAAANNIQSIFNSGEDFQNRPGGDVVVLDGTVDGSTHGLNVTSVFGGVKGGLSTFSKLYFISYYAEPTFVFSEIDRICSENEGVPCVVNMSFFTYDQNSSVTSTHDEWNAAARTLVNKHKLKFIAAAGNSDQDSCGSRTMVHNGQFIYYWPDKLEENNDIFIHIGAATNSKSKAYFSDHGTCVKYYTPGVDICASVGNSFVVTSGTSFSSPLFASMISILWGRNPNKTFDQILQMIDQLAESLYGGPTGQEKFVIMPTDQGTPPPTSGPPVTGSPTDPTGAPIVKPPSGGGGTEGTLDGGAIAGITIASVIVGLPLLYFLYKWFVGDDNCKTKKKRRKKRSTKNTSPSPGYFSDKSGYWSYGSTGSSGGSSIMSAKSGV